MKTLAGAVLAGGESRRMGRDKARLRVGAERLWQRQVRILVEAGAEPVVVVRRPGQRALGREVPHVRDGFPGAGPLAGLEAALRATEAAWVAVLAVDMPAMDAAWFRRLRRRCRAGVGAVGQGPEGFEPLAAIYPREALPAVVRRLGRGERSMQALVAGLVRARRMAIVRLTRKELWRMENWNTPINHPRASREAIYAADRSHMRSFHSGDNCSDRKAADRR